MHYRAPLLIFSISFCLFILMDYGGVRSPDSELVFRVAESLAAGRGFAIDAPLAKARTFGITRGMDGRLYTVFPPFESVALVPFVDFGRSINKTGWYTSFPLPVSHYVDLQPLLESSGGKIKQRWKPAAENLQEHALRFLCSAFNPLITSLTVVVFWL